MRVITTVAALMGAAALAAPAQAWQPEPATYGIAEQHNVPVRMRDGTVLRADVYSPADASGKPAAGPFPVVMTQSPYGKDAGLGLAGQSGTGEFPYLIQRGYIDVVADVRGAGDSHGAWGLFDPVQAQDGAQLVRWAAKLPHSSGKVGLYGSSYLGIDQLLTAARVGRRSPLKAIFPVIAGNDLYRDTAYFGGVPGLEFDAIFLGLTGALDATNPLVETGRATDPDPADTVQVETQHAGGLVSYHADAVLDTELNGEQRYDEAYWHARNPRSILRKVVANRIPAFLVGGWYDLFQRGEPLNFSGLQNAWAGRPVSAPMLPHQRLTGRYQLVMGPWYHVTAGDGLDMGRLHLQWFDRWLKGIDTGITHTSTPLHLFELGDGAYREARRYPFPEATPTPYYLGAGNTLGTARPTDAAGADPIVFTGAASPCDRQSDQWGAGGAALATSGQNPCASDDRTLQAGPGALTYTTAPFAADEVIAGPIDTTIFASSTRPDTFLEATVEDIAPDGTSGSLTAGGLLGSLRALDSGQTWLAPDGHPLLPYHPYTRASVRAVPSGEVTRFDIEVFPTFGKIAKGHSLRLTLTTSDTPHLGFTPDQLQNLAGGVYQVQRNAGAASFVELPLASPDAFAQTCSICVKAGP
jgi:putative CocE/NonD family hydrolase